MFIILTVAMVSGVYTYINTHQMVHHVTYVQFIAHQLYFNNKAVGGEREKDTIPPEPHILKM